MTTGQPLLSRPVKDHETTARSRELGIELRRARERIGYTGGQLARKLGWSNSRISRLEGGMRFPPERGGMDYKERHAGEATAV